ncbi:MAG: hypothetical protein ACYDGR_00530 [Candidatus Dormibacteria bacterium]
MGEERIQRPDVAAEERGGDPNQGMVDEADLGSSSLQEAHFWRRTYLEILHMEEGVMARIRELMSAESDVVRQEVELSNVPVIAAQIDRFRQRSQFWTHRIMELEREQALAE